MFSRPDRCSQPVVPAPPCLHLGAYLTGGLKDLYHRISRGEALDNTAPDVHTNSNGQFCPGHDGPVVMANRYYITEVLSTRGQSAVLVYAEDLFNENKLVVIKVLHTSYFNIGAQEAECLRRLATADPLHVSHTVKLLNTFIYGGHYCMVFESLNPDPITEVFDSLHLPNCTHLEKIKKLTLQLLAVLGFLRQHNTIHADLKPENILLKHTSDLNSVQVIDFGNSIQHVHQEVSLYYQDFHVQTLLYRAPEVMFGIPFGTEIDMWSLGCILCELYLGKPLFFGRSKEEILSHITSILGPLPKEIFQRGKYSQELEKFTADVQQEDATLKLMQHLPDSRDYAFANFLAKLFRYDPDERLSPAEAAQHPFLAQELCISFLLPQASKKCQSSSILLNSSTYKEKVKISSEVRRQNPSTYDLLVMGTELKTDQVITNSPGVSNFQETKVAEVQPYKQEADVCSPAHAQFELPVHLNHQSSRSSSPHTSQQFAPSLNQRTSHFQHSSHSHTSNNKQHSHPRGYEKGISDRFLSPTNQRYRMPAFNINKTSSLNMSPSKGHMRSTSPVKQEPVPFYAQSVMIIKKEELRRDRHENRTLRTDKSYRGRSEAQKGLKSAFHSPVKVLVSEHPSRSANQFVSRHSHCESNQTLTVSPSGGISSQSTYQADYGHTVSQNPYRTKSESQREEMCINEGENSGGSSFGVSRSSSGQNVQETVLKCNTVHSFGKSNSPVCVQKPRISRFSVSPERTKNSKYSKRKEFDRNETDLSNKRFVSSPQLSDSSGETLVHRSSLQKRRSGGCSPHSDLGHKVSPQVQTQVVQTQETEWKVPLQVNSRRTKIDMNMKRRKLILEQAAIESIQDQTALLVSDMEDLSGDEARCIMLETTVQCEELEREKRSDVCSGLRNKTSVEQNHTLRRRDDDVDINLQDNDEGNKSHLIESTRIQRRRHLENDQIQKQSFKIKSHSYESSIITSSKGKSFPETKQGKDPRKHRTERTKARWQHKISTSPSCDQTSDEQESSDGEDVEVMNKESVPKHNDVRIEKRIHGNHLQSRRCDEEKENPPPVSSVLQTAANCIKHDHSLKENSFTEQKYLTSKFRNSAMESFHRAGSQEESKEISKQRGVQNSSETEHSSVELNLKKSYNKKQNISLNTNTPLTDKETYPNQCVPSNENEFPWKHFEKQSMSEDNDIPLDEWSSESDSEVNYIYGINKTTDKELKCKLKPSQENPQTFRGAKTLGVSQENPEPFGGAKRQGASGGGRTQISNTHHQTFTESQSQSPAQDQEDVFEDGSPANDDLSSFHECSSPDRTTLPSEILKQRVQAEKGGESGPCVVSQVWRPETTVSSYQSQSTSLHEEELVLRCTSTVKNERLSLGDALSSPSDSSLLQLAEDSDDMPSNKSDVFDISYCGNDDDEEEGSDRESTVSKYTRDTHAKRKLKFARKDQSRISINPRSGLSEAEKEQLKNARKSHHDPYVFHSSPSMKSSQSYSTSKNLSSKKAKSSIYRLKNRTYHNKRSIISKGRRKTATDRTKHSYRTTSAEDLSQQGTVQRTRRKPTRSTITYMDLTTEPDAEEAPDMSQHEGRTTLKELLVDSKKMHKEGAIRNNTEQSRRIGTQEHASSIRNIQTGSVEKKVMATKTQLTRTPTVTKAIATSQHMECMTGEGEHLRNIDQHLRRKNIKETFPNRIITEGAEEGHTITQETKGQTFEDRTDHMLRKGLLQNNVQETRWQMFKKHIHPNHNQHSRGQKLMKKKKSYMRQELIDVDKELLSERSEEVLQDNVQQGRRKKRRKKGKSSEPSVIGTISPLSKIPRKDNSDSESEDSLKSKVCFRKINSQDSEDRYGSVQEVNNCYGGESLEQSSLQFPCNKSINKTVKMLLENAKRSTPCITTSSPRQTMNSSGRQRKVVDLNDSVILVTEGGNRKRSKSDRHESRTPAKSNKRKRTQEHDDDEIVLLIS